MNNSVAASNEISASFQLEYIHSIRYLLFKLGTGYSFITIIDIAFLIYFPFSSQEPRIRIFFVSFRFDSLPFFLPPSPSLFLSPLSFSPRPLYTSLRLSKQRATIFTSLRLIFITIGIILSLNF